MRSGLSKHADPHLIGKRVLDFWQYAINKSITDREEFLKPEQIIDIDYREFVKNPTQQIQAIYTHFGYDLDSKTLDAMEAFIENQSEEEHTPHHYKLEDFGLSEERVQEAFSNYNRIHNF